MTTAPVSHLNPKGKKKEKEKEKEKEEEKEEQEKEKEEKEQEKEKEENEKEKEKEQEKEKEKVKKKAKEKEKEKEKEKVKKKAKEKEKKKEKKVKVVSCDVKQQYPFEGFNIDGEGPTELMSSFSQWINEGLYKHHAKKDKDDHNLANFSDLESKQLDFVFGRRIGSTSQSNIVILNIDIPLLIVFSKHTLTMPLLFLNMRIKLLALSKDFGIPAGLPWHLTDEVYVPVNCNGEFHWVLAIVVLKERHIKVYDLMSSSRTNRKLCVEIQ
ncbi:hypothetical protein H5410_012916 [Solanum commersonii]|uniref:Ubiquitin-like protease family profile domain-containing protein n=1 Tax=Solanum commersonii TaxID=4109 RepID=A0A9J6ATZ9_SOLCO|nr:hypothetical protein H5410_012916 [Solanum commersonii]